MANEYKIAIHIAGKLESSLNNAISGANKQLGMLGKGTGAVMSGIGKVAETFGKATVAGFAATASAMAAGAKYAVDVGKDFESAMSSAAATAGVTQGSEAYAKMEEAAREAGATTSKTASEAANALEYMALAGWDVNTATSKLPDILHLSEATGLDLATTSDLVTDSLSAMGVGVDQLSDYMDVLAKAQNSSNMNVQQEMDAFIKSGGILQSLGVGYEDAATALGLMANNGLKGAEAGTALNAIMRNLTKPGGESADAMEALGLSMFDAQGEFIGMENGLQQINDKLAGMSSEEQTKYLNQLGGRYGSVLGLLLGNFEDIEDEQGNVTNGWKKLSGEIENSEGAMEGMRNTKMDNLAGDIDIITSAVQDLGIEFYQAFSPEIRGLVQGVTAQVGELKEAFQDGGWEGFSEELGQSLADAVIELGNKAPEIIDQVGILANNVVGAFGKEENADGIGKAAVGILESLSANLMHFGGTLGNTALSVIDSFVTAFAEDNAVQKISAGAVDMINSLKQGFEDHGEDIADGAVTIITQLAAAIPDQAEAILGLAGTILEQLSKGFADNGEEIGQAAADLITDLSGKLAENFPEIIDTGGKIVGNLLTGLVNGAGALIVSMPLLFNDVKNAILSIDWLDVGLRIVTAIWQGVQSLWGSFIEFLTGLSAVTEPTTDPSGQTLASGWHYEKHSGQYYNEETPNMLYDREGAEGAGAFNVAGQVDAATEAYNKASEAAKNATKEFTGADDAVDKFNQALAESTAQTGGETTDTLVSGLADIEPEALAAGTAAGTSLDTGFADGAQGVTATAQNTASSITSQFSGLSGQMAVIGQQIGQGLAVGLRSMVGTVQAQAAALAQAVNDAVAAKAQIGSPSKVMIGYGNFIGQGLAIGMEDSMRGVNSAASGLGGAATNRGAIMNGIGVRGGGGGNASVTYAPVINVTGSNLTEGDVRRAIQLSMDDFDKYMKRWQKQRGRVAFA